MTKCVLVVYMEDSHMLTVSVKLPLSRLFLLSLLGSRIERLTFAAVILSLLIKGQGHGGNGQSILQWEPGSIGKGATAQWQGGGQETKQGGGCGSGQGGGHGGGGIHNGGHGGRHIHGGGGVGGGSGGGGGGHGHLHGHGGGHGHGQFGQ